MNLNRYLDIAPEVKKALDEGRPVVALESTETIHPSMSEAELLRRMAL